MPGDPLPDFSRSSDSPSPRTVQALRSRPTPRREPGQRGRKPEGHRTWLCPAQPPYFLWHPACSRGLAPALGHAVFVLGRRAASGDKGSARPLPTRGRKLVLGTRQGPVKGAEQSTRRLLSLAGPPLARWGDKAVPSAVVVSQPGVHRTLAWRLGGPCTHLWGVSGEVCAPLSPLCTLHPFLHAALSPETR